MSNRSRTPVWAVLGLGTIAGVAGWEYRHFYRTAVSRSEREIALKTLSSVDTMYVGRTGRVQDEQSEEQVRTLLDQARRRAWTARDKEVASKLVDVFAFAALQRSIELGKSQAQVDLSDPESRKQMVKQYEASQQENALQLQMERTNVMKELE